MTTTLPKLTSVTALALSARPVTNQFLFPDVSRPASPTLTLVTTEVPLPERPVTNVPVTSPTVTAETTSPLVDAAPKPVANVFDSVAAVTTPATVKSAGVLPSEVV